MNQSPHIFFQSFHTNYIDKSAMTDLSTDESSGPCPSRKDGVHPKRDALGGGHNLPSSFHFLSPSPYYGSAFHLRNCVTGPMLSSVLFGTLFAGMDAAQGAQKFTPRAVVQYSGFLYIYNVLQCPMEAINGKPSLLHNALSAGILGYIGVQSGRVGIPFVDPYTLFAHGRNVSPPVVGFFVYGGIGFAFGMLGGKSI